MWYKYSTFTLLTICTYIQPLPNYQQIFNNTELLKFRLGDICMYVYVCIYSLLLCMCVHSTRGVDFSLQVINEQQRFTTIFSHFSCPRHANPSLRKVLHNDYKSPTKSMHNVYLCICNVYIVIQICDIRILFFKFICFL